MEITKEEINLVLNKINKFGEENQMNKKILFGISVFFTVLFLTKSYFYGLLYSLAFFLVFIKPIREGTYKYLNLIEPTVYFLVRRYTPLNFFSLRSSFAVLYQGIYTVLLLILVSIIIIHFDNLLLSFYQRELQKEIGDRFMIWVIISSGFMILGNLVKLTRLFLKVVLSWVFILFYIAIAILLNIENPTYFKAIISPIAPLLLMVILLSLYKPIYRDYVDKYSYFRLWYNESKNDWKKYLYLLESQTKKELNNISIILDNPIVYKSDDMFGYKNISDNTYNLIKGINSNNGSYSIGIIGEWGLGKSSIIGMLKESKLKLDSNIILHDFNPWDYNKSDLVNSFIVGIASKIGKKDLTKLLIEYLETLSGINSTTGIVFKLMKFIFGKERTIEEIRDSISEELGKINKKLVIVIDDLDRCEPEEIITMLNVVKNIGNFSHVIYLISFDKLHIIKALKEKGFHEDYIEKIINTEIHIPLPDKESKAKYFTEKFSEILSEINIKEDIIKESCRIISESGNTGLDEIFEKENLRLIKKLLNKLNVNLKLVFNTNKTRVGLLSKEDIATIVLINYIKIKHLEFYNDSIKKRNLMSRDTLFYKTPNRPPMYLNLKERRLEKIFLDNIIGLTISFGENDTLQIGNKNTLKDVADLTYQIKNLERNWEILREFS